MLNQLWSVESTESKRIESPYDPPPLFLPEDVAMRGMLWAADYLPWDQFDRRIRDDRHPQASDLVEERRKRILWLGVRIAERGRTAGNGGLLYSHDLWRLICCLGCARIDI